MNEILSFRFTDGISMRKRKKGWNLTYQISYAFRTFPEPAIPETMCVEHTTATLAEYTSSSSSHLDQQQRHGTTLTSQYVSVVYSIRARFRF